jgi:hypothetical protein
MLIPSIPLDDGESQRLMRICDANSAKKKMKRENSSGYVVEQKDAYRRQLHYVHLLTILPPQTPFATNALAYETLESPNSLTLLLCSYLTHSHLIPFSFHSSSFSNVESAPRSTPIGWRPQMEFFVKLR